MNVEQLELFRPETKKAPKEAWKAPEAADFNLGHILAFDPSLSACGVVALYSGAEGLTVWAAHKFPNPDVEAAGNEEHYRKAVALTAAVTKWRLNSGATDAAISDFDGGWPYVHEAPPVGGGRIRAPESALLAGLAIRLSLHHHHCLGMVAPQAHKKFICGNGNADKKEHHAALAKLAKDLPIHNYELITNEAKRDALSIALYYLWTNNGGPTT